MRCLGARHSVVGLVALSLVWLLAACGGGAAAPAAEPTRPTVASPSPATSSVKLTLIADGSEARYKAREVFVGQTAPADAIGVTRQVSGEIVLSPTGAIVKEQSTITVDLRQLKSDSGMRDGFIQRSTLDTGQHPNAIFVVSEAKGLPTPLPATGEATFQLLGDLTLRGVTRPATWEVKAVFAPGEVSGTATTAFLMADYSIPVPRVPRVASIEDQIKLELDFKATRAAA